MTSKNISFITPLYIIVFLVVSWAAYAVTTICPDPLVETDKLKNFSFHDHKKKSILVKEKKTKKKVILKYTPVLTAENWRPDANIIAFIKSVENHPFANGKTKLVKYKDFGYVAKGYGNKAHLFTNKHTHDVKSNLKEAEKVMIDHILASNKVVDKYVHYELSHHQRNALVSLVYNIGPFAFRTSAALKALNKGNIKVFKIQAFDSRKGFVCAGGKHNKGLMHRRAHELRIWEKGSYYSMIM